MDMLKVFLPCFPFTCEKRTTSFPVEKPTLYAHLSEKTTSYPPKRAAQPILTTEQAASKILSALQNAEKAGPSLTAHIQSLVHQAGGWSEYLATKILSGLETVLRAGTQMNGALKEAYDKACDAAKAIEGFAAEHPIATAVFCTVIALGVLVILAPYVLEALGFAELGPIEGSWAASWQATYRGFVPARSLFSYFQRLGMKWAPRRLCE